MVENPENTEDFSLKDVENGISRAKTSINVKVTIETTRIRKSSRIRAPSPDVRTAMLFYFSKIRRLLKCKQKRRRGISLEEVDQR